MYITYEQNGTKKKGVVNNEVYDKLSCDPSVSDLEIHPNEISMNNKIRESHGKPLDNRKVIFG